MLGASRIHVIQLLGPRAVIFCIERYPVGESPSGCSSGKNVDGVRWIRHRTADERRGANIDEWPAEIHASALVGFKQRHATEGVADETDLRITADNS